jgi:hypothetical protein
VSLFSPPTRSLASSYVFNTTTNCRRPSAVSNAYRSIPVHPSWWALVAFRWRGKIYADLRLPFGSKGAVAAFARFSDALRRLISVTHPLAAYLDDFMLAALLRAECAAGYELLVRTLRTLGWVVNEEKCVAPCQRLVFLGVGVATVSDGEPRISVFIDEQRLARLRREINSICDSDTAWTSVSRMESLLGHLQFCAIVLGDARSLLRYSFSALHHASRRDAAFVYLCDSVVAELKGWTHVHRDYTYSRFVDRRLTSTVMASWDASSSGWGIFFAGSGARGTWKELSSEATTAFSPRFNSDGSPASAIALLELWGMLPQLLPLANYWLRFELRAATDSARLAAGYRWLREYGPRCQGLTVVIHCDNQAVCGMLKHLWGPDEYTPLILEMRSMMLSMDVVFDVYWISTHDNTLSDLLSRGRMPEYRVALVEHRTLPYLPEDDQDWCFRRDIVIALDAVYQFQCDGAVDTHRANAQFSSSWTAFQDCRMQRFHGLRVYLKCVSLKERNPAPSLTF